MLDFVWGALTMACVTAAFLFFRFWRLTSERLLLFFALAFCAFALNYAALFAAEPNRESHHYIYLLRLIAFGLIIAGILDKNRRSG